MSRRYVVHIGRVVVREVSGAPSAGSNLRGLIEAALAAALAEAPLPAGRSGRTAVQVQAPLLQSDGGIAHAIGSGVAQALQGGASHG